MREQKTTVGIFACFLQLILSKRRVFHVLIFIQDDANDTALDRGIGLRCSVIDDFNVFFPLCKVYRVTSPLENKTPSLPSRRIAATASFSGVPTRSSQRLRRSEHIFHLVDLSFESNWVLQTNTNQRWANIDFCLFLSSYLHRRENANGGEKRRRIEWDTRCVDIFMGSLCKRGEREEHYSSQGNVISAHEKGGEEESVRWSSFIQVVKERHCQEHITHVDTEKNERQRNIARKSLFTPMIHCTSL